MFFLFSFNKLCESPSIPVLNAANTSIAKQFVSWQRRKIFLPTLHNRQSQVSRHLWKTLNIEVGPRGHSFT